MNQHFDSCSSTEVENSILYTPGNISRTKVSFWLIFSDMIALNSIFQNNFMKNSEQFFCSNGSFNTAKIRKIRVNGGYSRLQKSKNQSFPGPEIFRRLRRRLVLSISAIKNGGLRLTFPPKNFFVLKKARFGHYWMNRSFPGKSGSVRAPYSSPPIILPKI